MSYLLEYLDEIESGRIRVGKELKSVLDVLKDDMTNRSGKLVAARPYLRPSYESLTPLMLEEIRQIIRQAG